jgi:hypothetical protein
MSTPECAEWRGLVAIHAIGQASEDEARELFEHLDQCDPCRQDADEVLGAATALSFLDPGQVDRIERETAAFYAPSGSLAVVTPVGGTGGTGAGSRGGRRRRGWIAGAGAAVLAVAAAIVAVVAVGVSPAPPPRTVALTGERGVVASVQLTAQTWGTHADLSESGQAPGQVLTVSMRTSSGRWWVAGSYRTTSAGVTEVQLSCAVQPSQVNEVWVTDQQGRIVLRGYVG